MINAAEMGGKRPKMAYGKRLLRLAVIMSGMILFGCMAAHITIAAIDTLLSRVGYLGGEVFIPVILVGLPVFVWNLRGWWDKEIRQVFSKDQRRGERGGKDVS